MSLERRCQNFLPPKIIVYSSVFFNFSLSLYILRERDHEWERGRERIPSKFHAVSAESDVGLELRNGEIMT